MVNGIGAFIQSQFMHPPGGQTSPGKLFQGFKVSSFQLKFDFMIFLRANWLEPSFSFLVGLRKIARISVNRCAYPLWSNLSNFIAFIFIQVLDNQIFRVVLQLWWVVCQWVAEYLLNRPSCTVVFGYLQSLLYHRVRQDQLCKLSLLIFLSRVSVLWCL